MAVPNQEEYENIIEELRDDLDNLYIPEKEDAWKFVNMAYSEYPNTSEQNFVKELSRIRCDSRISSGVVKCIIYDSIEERNKVNQIKTKLSKDIRTVLTLKIYKSISGTT